MNPVNHCFKLSAIGVLRQHVLAQNANSGQFETVIDRIHYKVTYQKSDYNTWTYFSLVSLPELKKEAKSIGWITFTVCLILLTLSNCPLLAVCASTFWTKPSL